MSIERPMEGRALHFIAIGGAGMSGLALVCHELGAEVSGSDRSESSYLERVRAAGIAAAVGHDAANLPDGAEVVVSTAIGPDNPELSLARERGQRVMHRGELLAELCARKRLLAVAGTHGKTTTTAMAVHALRASGADPAFFIGGELPGAGRGGAPANAGWGEGEWVVAEADESDGSFLDLAPEIAVITNLELDHHSRWSSLGELREAFAVFSTGAAGRVGGPGVDLPAGPGRSVRFALEPEPGSPPHASADLLATHVEPTPAGGTLFRAAGGGVDAEVELAVPGRHNVANALAALGGLALAGADTAACASALANFGGVARRMELKGEVSGRAGLRRLRAPPDGGGRRAGRGAPARPEPPDRGLPAPSLLAHQGSGDRVRHRALRRRRDRGPRGLPGPRAAGGGARGCEWPPGRRGGGLARRRPSRLVAA